MEFASWDWARTPRHTSSTYYLKVQQQPCRARLCSFKEENDTIDRRPVDPPPVVEVLNTATENIDHLEAPTLFVRAVLVHQYPDRATGRYTVVTTPTGINATTGETIQTPEKLRLLDNRWGALCIFAKLSVRMPGVFRLEFTLYETSREGIRFLTATVSDPFEVFSPKLFTGMRESTLLTRHLATQGIKVKLRTDTSAGRTSSTRRRAGQSGTVTPARSSPSRTPSSANPLKRHPDPAFLPPPPPNPRMPKPSLVWDQSSSLRYPHVADYPDDYPEDVHMSETRSAPPPPNLPSRRRYADNGLPGLPHPLSGARSAPPPSSTDGQRRWATDDGLARLAEVAALPRICETPSKAPLIPAVPSTDLSAFSLNPPGPSYSNSPSQTPSASRAHYTTASVPQANRSSSSIGQTYSSSHPTPSSSSTPMRDSSRPQSPFLPNFSLLSKGGDDGIPILPPPAPTVLPRLSNILLAPVGGGSTVEGSAGPSVPVLPPIRQRDEL